MQQSSQLEQLQQDNLTLRKRVLELQEGSLKAWHKQRLTKENTYEALRKQFDKKILQERRENRREVAKLQKRIEETEAWYAQLLTKRQQQIQKLMKIIQQEQYTISQILDRNSQVFKEVESGSILEQKQSVAKLYSKLVEDNKALRRELLSREVRSQPKQQVKESIRTPLTKAKSKTAIKKKN